MKDRVKASALARIAEDVLVYSMADAGTVAPDVIPEAIDTIARFYGERPRDTARRIARRASIETHATPDPATYTTRAAVLALTEGKA